MIACQPIAREVISGTSWSLARASLSMRRPTRWLAGVGGGYRYCPGCVKA